jgi:predicted O-methyltransferase YrrM
MTDKKFVFDKKVYNETWKRLRNSRRYKEFRKDIPRLTAYKDVNWKEADIHIFQEITSRRDVDLGGIHGSEMLFMLQACLVEEPKFLLEVGVRGGQSTRFLAAVAERFDGQLIAIEGILHPRAVEKIEELNLSHRVTFINRWSPWLGEIPDWEIDFLFLDGDHDFISTIVDYHFFNHFVKKGGLIVFHNPEVQAVRRAIDEAIERDNLEEIGKAEKAIMFRKTIPRKKVYFQEGRFKPGPNKRVIIDTHSKGKEVYNG